jgi:hypothetical protein
MVLYRAAMGSLRQFAGPVAEPMAVVLGVHIPEV